MMKLSEERKKKTSVENVLSGPLNSSTFFVTLLQSLRNMSRLHAATDLLLISTSNQGTQSILPQTAALHPHHLLGVYEVKELHSVGNMREIKRQGNHTVLVWFSHALWMAPQENI